MPWNSTRVSIRTFHEALLRIHAHDVQPFHTRIFGALDLIFEGSKYALEIFGEGGRYYVESNLPFNECREGDIYLRTEELVRSQSPMFERLAAGETRVMQLSDFITLQQLKRKDLYHDVFRKIGINRQIGVPLQSGTCMGGLTINRLGQDYDKEDMLLAAAIAPQVAKAFEVDQMIKRLKPSVAAMGQVDFGPLRKLGLTRREAEVLHWMAQGKRDAEISTILGTSVRTVNHQVRAVLGKLSAETRTAAVSIALEKCGEQSGDTTFSI